MRKDHIENKSNTISAGEINKFVYCPYQWYYQRLYGSKKLRELAKIRNEYYGYEDSDLSHFNKGTGFHKNYHFAYKIKQFLLKIFWITLSILFFILIYQVIKHVL
ncbi:MAG TPA: hypothetical protein PLL17_06275 [Defluviitaleaceae bacterium]|jgi:uncharacterized membrane protein|nr:hypothetical protein [Defluviitaleaceae bacterium]